MATFFVAREAVYLLRVLSKGSAANFSAAHIAAFAVATRSLKRGEET